MPVTVTQINVFPIKSCRGTSLPSSFMTERGFALDRQWLIVKNDGTCLTQRQLPMMAQLTPRISDAEKPTREIEMELTAPGMTPLKITSTGEGETKRVVVWQDSCEATDEGDAVAAWLSTYLKTTCRLVRFSENFVRPVDKKYSKHDYDQVSFADGYPYLLISQASLDELNARMDQSLPMNRFRPNIVVEGCSPFEEDEWKTIKIGDTELHIVKPCARCVITCTDQETSEVSAEPLKTLSTFRNQMNKIMFGQNLVPEKLGTINVGDALQVLN